MAPIFSSGLCCSFLFSIVTFSSPLMCIYWMLAVVKYHQILKDMPKQKPSLRRRDPAGDGVPQPGSLPGSVQFLWAPRASGKYRGEEGMSGWIQRTRQSFRG
jgi:hypothetical protein